MAAELLSATPKGKLIVSGILFWYPLAGVTYQFLHYLIGLRRLGYDPYYVEDSARWIYDPRINNTTPDASGNIAAIAPILEAHGFGERWAYRGYYEDGQCYGMTEGQILQLYRDADAFLNVTGAQEMRDEQIGCARRLYVESDPFAAQVRFAQGDVNTTSLLTAHDTHFSFGENLGAADCTVPIERFHWFPTRQPVVMDLWAHAGGAVTTKYTTITTWHNKGKDVSYQGDVYYWTKDREFQQFLDLPQRRPVSFELATTVDADVQQLLCRHGWGQVDAVSISRSFDHYRTYIQNSRAEFTVARDQYVRPCTGWFSDRSVCYLAAGRPVITQETGFSKFMPTGKGLFGFQTMDDILAAVDEIERDYEGNCRDARDIAAEYFAAEKVLQKLLHDARLA